MSTLTIDPKAYCELVASRLPHVYKRGELTPEEKQFAELLDVLIEKFEERYPIKRLPVFTALRIPTLRHGHWPR
jgi:hypothetical protein